MSQNEPYSLYTAPDWRDFPDLELYMDQVISVLNKMLAPVCESEVAITSTMINNYVKQKLIPPPQNKKYNRQHLASLFMIFHFKRFMQLSDIARLLERMISERGVEGAYENFRREFSGAMQSLEKESCTPESGYSSDPIVHESALAFAQICAARKVFLATDWRDEPASEEKTEKKAKKKEEKKEEKKS